ncbi:hypothetical protein Tco_1063836, partial [Tanacetum coccineum]
LFGFRYCSEFNIAPIPSASLLPEDPVWLRESHQKKNIYLAYGVPGFVDAFRPLVFGLSSSEWLYKYNNNLGNLGNYQGSDDGPRSTIDAVGIGELRAEQLQILQHLKEREWQLQSEAPFRGHPYTGN